MKVRRSAISPSMVVFGFVGMLLVIVFALKEPKPGSFVRSIAHKTDKGWTVAFGKMNPKEDKILTAYEATQGQKPDQYDVKEAIDVALKDFTERFEGERRPYNVAVLPADQDQFWVYLVPAPTKPGIGPLGGDVCYLVSSDGSKIVARRQLHKAVIEKKTLQDKSQKQVAGIHTHVLTDTPEDTDVFHVLTREPTVPELIATQEFVFVGEKDGEIKYLDKAEEVLKKK